MGSESGFNLLSEITHAESSRLDNSKPVLLFESGEHAVYWMGITEDTAFRCNSYLIKSGEEAVLVDPGGHAVFAQVHDRVGQVLPPQNITGMILCHQDPDVASSMPDWLSLNAEMRVFSTPRTHVLLPHYGHKGYPAYDVETKPRFMLSEDKGLCFYPAPFLHSPGAFTTYDEASGFLFSGDIWAALDTDWQLVVPSFEEHIPKLDLFHKDYMASNKAATGFAHTIEKLDIRGILPQHGSLIRGEHVPLALAYLKNLECGLDLIYSDISENACFLADDENPVADIDADLRVPDHAPSNEDEPEMREARLKNAHLLDQALRQSERLAILKDKALHDLKVAERKLEELARLDGLLHIPNRRSFDETFVQEWRRAMRSDTPLSLFMIDIDHFKPYNDHYGHQIGDACLIRIAELIRKCMRRPGDMVARYGGEEFVCVLPDTPQEGAIPIAKAIMRSVQHAGIEHPASPLTEYLTLSIGIAVAYPSAADNPMTLIDKADACLYKAKALGRNRIVSDEGEVAF